MASLGLAACEERVPERAAEPPPEAPAGTVDTEPVPPPPRDAFDASPIPAPPPPAVAANTLFSLVPGVEGCDWEVRVLPDVTPAVFTTTDSCPRDVLWSGRLGEGDVFYEVAGGLTRLRPGSAPEELPVPDVPGASGWLAHFWFDPDGRLLVAYYADVPCVQDGGRCTYDLGARTIHSEMDDDGWERFTLTDGWAEAPEGEAFGRSLPPWGSRQVALAYAWDAQGGWTLTSAAPTRTEAGETPGVSVLDLSEAPGSFKLGGVIAETTCLAHRMASTGCGEYDGVLPSWFSEQADGAFDEIGAIPFEGGAWVFPVVFGDTPHIFGPVFLECGLPCEPGALSLPDGVGRQLSMSVSGPYLLVGREYRLTRAAVFTTGSTEPIFTLPADAISAWLPG